MLDPLPLSRTKEILSGFVYLDEILIYRSCQISYNSRLLSFKLNLNLIPFRGAPELITSQLQQRSQLTPSLHILTFNGHSVKRAKLFLNLATDKSFCHLVSFFVMEADTAHTHCLIMIQCSIRTVTTSVT